MPPKNGWLKSAPSTLMFELIPRWPEKESCPREGSTWTVGVKVMKSWKRRPLMGRFAIAVWSRVDVRTVLLVSTRGVSATTVTSSVTPPTPSETLRVTEEPTVTFAFRFTAWRPVISKVAS
jgi:hypothetical protein